MIDRWTFDEQADIEMHWSFVLRDLAAEVPADMPRTVKAAVAPVIGYMNKHSKRLSLDFDVVINRQQFSGKLSPEAAGLSEAAAKGLAAEIGKQAGIDPQKIRAAGRNAFDKFKKFLEKKRGV